MQSVASYHEIFGWEILKKSSHHAEMKIPSLESGGVTLYWSPKDGNCPTNPGTMTLMLSEIDKDKLLENKFWKSEFFLEYTDQKNNYSSWLDQNLNRIWLHIFNS
jgi:hypothetical protein